MQKERAGDKDSECKSKRSGGNKPQTNGRPWKEKRKNANEQLASTSKKLRGVGRNMA